MDSSGALVVSNINQIINGFSEVAGFKWDNSQKIWYAMQNCWQRKYGYCKFYDTVAPLAGIYISSKQVIISNDSKTWCIWMWKGRYGVTIGAEIGIYVYSKTYSITYLGRTSYQDWYRSATDYERMQISLSLYKNGKQVFSRSGYTWWQTGFKVGTKMLWDKLKMKATIIFPNASMARIFAAAMGTTNSNTTVSFTW